MFFDRFKALCDQRGISCKSAVMDMGLSNSIATKWKKTGAVPQGETLQKIADYFHVSVDRLLGQEKAPTDDGEREISNSQLMFALWGDSENVDEDDLDDVRRYAAFVKERKKKGK